MLHCGVEQNEYKLNEENKTQLYAVAAIAVCRGTLQL